MTFLVIKAFHIIAMVCWFAGFFYLPRLFVHHAQCQDTATIERFKIMERKLYRGIMTPAGIITVLLGAGLISTNPSYYLHAGWMHAKLFCVFLLIIHHCMCGYYLKKFKHDCNPHSHIYYRWFNELPTVFLITVIILAVVKPF